MSPAEITAFVEEFRSVEASLAAVEIWDPLCDMVLDGDSREFAVVRLIAGGPEVVARALAAGRAEVGLGPEDEGAEEVIGIISAAYERATGLSFASPEGEPHPGEVSAQMNEPRWWVLRSRAHRGAAAACREIERSQVLREFLLGHDRPIELFMVVEATTSDRHTHVYLQGAGIMALFSAPLSRGSVAEGRREVVRCYDVLRERYGLPDVLGPVPPDSLPHRDG
ncbi:hypothetical protein [Oerskovia sp. KBS0722]|uniref:hypothetical protein n=1 Tax=Oerskovia sp. KBS0722 TaxID=1179673 RepID=UPI00110DEA0E|nr:hypothetical protein [Oerskovia sp. KBS0722]QDW62751.1 hypothetical protein FFI11_009490 [Oerskovia sp. KBS0722]